MKGTSFKKFVSCFVAVYMVFTCNMPAVAFANEAPMLQSVPLEQAQPAQPLTAQAGATGTVTGGNQVISEDGVYDIAADATGYVIVDDGVEAELVGQGMDTVITDLNIIVGNNATVTIRDLHAEMSTKESPSLIDISDAGTLNIEGVNLLDNSTGKEPAGTQYFPAVIAVGPNADVVFGGSGVLYGYKYSLGAFIGSTADNTGAGSLASGKMTFVSGTWLLKGSQTGPTIGNDCSTQLGGDITINGGQLYLRGVARAAALGGSANGMGANVIINGGLVESYVEWQGSAVGYGGGKNTPGSLTVNGGSLKPLVGRNGYSAWGIDGTTTTANVVFWPGAVTSSHDTAPLAFDTSAYAGSDITVKVDGADFYTGPAAYAYTSSQLKNPADDQGVMRTVLNWVENTEANKTQDSDSSTNGSPLAGDSTLYFWLSKDKHTLTVGDESFSYKWDEAAGGFVPDDGPDTSWYKAGETSFTLSTEKQLAGLAAIVNGTAEGIDQDSFEGATVTLGADIELTAEDWTPIGDATHAFAGTFDGDGHAITGLAITSSTGGYRGLFGNNAGTVKNFTLAGQLGAEGATIGGGDCFGAAVAYNTGTVSDIVSSAVLYIGQNSTWAVGGVVARSVGGTVERCGFEGAIACDTSKDIRRVGGVVGHLTDNGLIDKCYNKGDVEAWNYRNGCEGTGGVLGSLDTKGTVSNCYSIGTIRNGKGDSATGGKQGTGGIVGSINAGDVVNCYATGNVYGPSSSGVLIGKVGNGSYTNLYTLDTARSYNQYNTLTDAELNLKYADGTCENEDGTIKFGGAAIGNSYNDGYTIANCSTKSAQDLKAAAEVLGEAFCADPASISNGFPILTWELEQGIALDTCSIAAIPDQAYTGEAIEPELTVTNAAGAQLEKGVDYQVSFSDNIEVGTATATIEGAGLYKGTLSATFKIAPVWQRLWGSTRWTTMASIVQDTFPATSAYAVVANGENFPDALAASAIAGAYKCPVITTKAASLSKEARGELTRLGVKNVFVVGGTSAVSSATETAIKGLNGGVKVTRLSGSTRQTTGTQVLNTVKKLPSFKGTVIIVSGWGYADALSISPWAYANSAPIMLARPTSEATAKNPAGLTAAQVSAIAACANKVVIIGGKNAVPTNVETALTKAGVKSSSITRLAGSNRYATSLEVAKWALANGSNAEFPVIATGQNFPDALAGAALCGSHNSIMVLADQGAKGGETALEAVVGNKASLKEGSFLGGKGAVSIDFAKSIAQKTDAVFEETVK